MKMKMKMIDEKEEEEDEIDQIDDMHWLLVLVVGTITSLECNEKHNIDRAQERDDDAHVVDDESTRMMICCWIVSLLLFFLFVSCSLLHFYVSSHDMGRKELSNLVKQAKDQKVLTRLSSLSHSFFTLHRDHTRSQIRSKLDHAFLLIRYCGFDGHVIGAGFPSFHAPTIIINSIIIITP